MTKKKKITLSVTAAALALFLVLGCFAAWLVFFREEYHFTVNDTLADGEGKKATVILLGGQSNASGCSSDEYLAKNVSEEKYAEYKNGYDNVYINYFAGLNASNAFVKCSTAQGEVGGYFGPELGMAEKLHELYPDETFFIIKCAWGATDLFEQWLSPSAKGKTGDLYKKFVAYVEASLEYLVSKNYDIKIEGMCWMQGESDSFSTIHAGNYGSNLTDLIGDLRKKFSRYASADGFVFVDAYIADNPMYWVYCDIVNAEKDKVAAASPRNVLVDTIGAGLTCANEPADTPDLAHYDSLSEIKLGNLFIEELMRTSRK